MRILIVDDDRFFAQRISEMLQDRSIETTQVQSAEEALGVDAESYDGAIVDVMLPNNPDASGITMEESRGGFSAGIAVARRLLQKNANIRIVMLSSDVTLGEGKTWSAERSIPFVGKDEGSELLLHELRRLGLVGEPLTPLAFVVHGHDDLALLELKNYIQNALKWQEPVVLREQPSSGKTIIEKFEEFTRRIDCVFVLLTPEDRVVSSGSNEDKRRSRQNVIFELGFFYSSFGRKSGRVLLLHKGEVELPSDIAGIVWVDISKGIPAAGEVIRKELAGVVSSFS